MVCIKKTREAVGLWYDNDMWYDERRVGKTKKKKTNDKAEKPWRMYLGNDTTNELGNFDGKRRTLPVELLWREDAGPRG